MNNKIRSAISHFLVALLVLFSTLTLSAPSAVAQKPQADSKQVGTTYRGILFRCLKAKWPDIRISGDGDRAFVPETGQNLAWDADKQAWIDIKTLECVCPKKCPPPHFTTTPAPPSKKEKIKEE